MTANWRLVPPKGMQSQAASTTQPRAQYLHPSEKGASASGSFISTAESASQTFPRTSRGSARYRGCRRYVLRKYPKAATAGKQTEIVSQSNIELEQQLGRSEEWVSQSSAMDRLREQVARVGPTSATVLLRGESGSGKELVARSIHDSSNRASGPFVAINCAALTPTLLESELFGHEKVPSPVQLSAN